MPLPAAVLPLIAAGIGAGSQAIGQGRNNKFIAEQTRLQNEYNRRATAEQNTYNSPEQQMARYKKAGLNPHLIYGQGTPGNQSAPVQYQTPTANKSVPDPVPQFIQASLAGSQMGLNEARETQSYQDTALKSVTTDIAKTNPMLSPSVALWVTTSMEETARLKGLEARQWMTKSQDGTTMRFQQKINAELESLIQKLGLNTEDLKIRNEILESKEFENALKSIQLKWLKNAEVTPEHIRQGLMLLLSKMVGR